jgi:hypothetical protein
MSRSSSLQCSFNYRSKRGGSICGNSLVRHRSVHRRVLRVTVQLEKSIDLNDRIRYTTVTVIWHPSSCDFPLVPLAHFVLRFLLFLGNSIVRSAVPLCLFLLSWQSAMHIPFHISDCEFLSDFADFADFDKNSPFTSPHYLQQTKYVCLFLCFI